MPTCHRRCSKFPEVHDFARIDDGLAPKWPKCTANPRDFVDYGQNSPKCTKYSDSFC